MLDYIKQQIQAKFHEDDAIRIQQEEAQMDEAVLECAHVIQELDDLSIEGTEAGSTRPFTKIDIPLEDDVEITAVELNALDGRVLSAPMDATVQEMADYTTMKTFDDFYQEAYRTTTQFQRENDYSFSQRCRRIANEKFAAYKNYCIQEGLFGFDKIDLSDDRVPSRVVMEFGTMASGKDYTVKLPVKAETDNKRRVLKKQLDSLAAFQDMNERTGCIQEAAFAAFGKMAGVEKAEDIWSRVTPVDIVIPAKPSDKFRVAVGFEIDGTGETQYLEWSSAIKANDETMVCEQASISTDEINSITAISKSEAIKQEAALIASGYHAPSRFYQEAIDFGDPDAAPEADPNAPAVSFDAPPPPAEGGDAAAAPADGAPADDGAAPAEGETTDVAPAEGEAPADENKEVVDTNNVSDQIAEKISDDTQADANADADLNIDGVDSTSDVDAEPTEDDLNAELSDEPAAAETSDVAPADTSDIDFDNMTMDELLAQGQERMKTMTMNELKEFLSGSSIPSSEDAPPAVDEGIQESFF